jgi:hypothetical protein
MRQTPNSSTTRDRAGLLTGRWWISDTIRVGQQRHGQQEPQVDPGQATAVVLHGVKQLLVLDPRQPAGGAAAA